MRSAGCCYAALDFLRASLFFEDSFIDDFAIEDFGQVGLMKGVVGVRSQVSRGIFHQPIEVHVTQSWKHRSDKLRFI